MDNEGAGTAFMVGFALGTALSGCVSFWAGGGCEREAAVKAGVARYEVNPTTGETRFVYGSFGGAKAGPKSAEAVPK